MDYLALAEEFDNVVFVGVVGEPEDIIVGDSSLLLCREILVEVGERISLRFKEDSLGMENCEVYRFLNTSFPDSTQGVLDPREK